MAGYSTSKSGLSLPKSVHGRYSKNLVRMREFYEKSLHDPSLMDLREPVALLDSIVKRLVEMSSEADTPKFRMRCLELMDRALQYQRDGELARMAATFNQLHELLRQGAKDAQTLKLLAEETERLARTIEGAWNVKLKAQSSINHRDLVVVMGEWAQIVMRVAPKPLALQILTAISATINKGRMIGAGFEDSMPDEVVVDAQPTGGPGSDGVKSDEQDVHAAHNGHAPASSGGSDEAG